MNEKTQGRFFTIGLVRGLIGLIVGGIAGIALVSVIRMSLGLQLWAWGPEANHFGFAESAWVVGAIFGFAGFMISVGVLQDWFKWMAGKETSEHPQDAFPSGWKRYLSATYDHKAIGGQYGVTSLLILSIAGSFALTSRTELISPGIQFLQLKDYNTFMSLHGIMMIVAMLLGVAAMSNFLVPVMIGANDMAFPR